MKTTTVIGLALIAYNLWENAHETASGSGTLDDPFVMKTHSPLLSLIGITLTLFGETIDG